MPATEGAFVDGKGAAQQRLYVGEAVGGLNHSREIVEVGGRFGVVEAVGGFVDRERPAQEILGAAPVGQFEPEVADMPHERGGRGEPSISPEQADRVKREQLPASGLPFCGLLDFDDAIVDQRADRLLAALRFRHLPQEQALNEAMAADDARIALFLDTASQQRDGVEPLHNGGPLRFIELRITPGAEGAQPREDDVVWRKQGGEIQGVALGGTEPGERGSEDRGKALFVVVPAEHRVGAFGEMIDAVEIIEAHSRERGSVGDVGMLREVGADDFHGEGEATESMGNDVRGGPVGVGGTRAVLFQEEHTVARAEFADGEEAEVLAGAVEADDFTAGGDKDVEVGAEEAQGIGLLGAEQPQVGDVIEEKEDGTLSSEAVPNGFAQSAEVEVEALALFVAGGSGELRIELEDGEAQVAEALARDEESTSRVTQGVGLGVGERQFGLSDAAEPVDAGDDAGFVAAEELTELLELIEAADEASVVRWDGAARIAGIADQLVLFVETAGERGERIREGTTLERVEALWEERFDLQELAADDLLKMEAERVGISRVESGESLGDLLGGEASDQRGDFDDVDGKGCLAEGLPGDLMIDPCLPLTPTPLAAEIRWRDDGHEEP